MDCSASDINNVLSGFSSYYVQVNDSLWFFKYTDEFDGNYLSKEIALFYNHFEKITNDRSRIFISRLESHYYYYLPEEIHNYLEQE